MEEFINNILIEPLKSPTILWLSIAYLIAESITTYDTRLIQSHSRDFQSSVATDAGGRMLPSWVGYIVGIGWGLFIAILVLNWKYAIVLFVVKFILKVVPILENIGAAIMSPFLKDEPRY